MNSRPPPPRYVVQSVDSQTERRRRWLWLGLAWLVSLVMVAVAVYLAVDRGPLAPPGQADQRQLRRDNDALRQQVATLTRSEQVARVAAASLKDTLADREEQINGLRADLAFYSHLIGGGTQHPGLQMQAVHLGRVAKSRAWNITITLTHNVKRGDRISGKVRVAVEGILKGHLTRLKWEALAGEAQQDGLEFSFKYFQQVRGTLMLPDDFIPNQLRVTVDPKQGNAITRTVAWSAALKPVENDDVQQQQ